MQPLHFTDMHLHLGLPWQLSGKELPVNAGNAGSIPAWGKYPGKEMATRSSILAWEISWTEESGGLQSMGLQNSWTQLSD